MDATHTPEPWRLGRTELTELWAEETRLGVMFANNIPYHTDEANANRIITCVNALAGIESPLKWVEEMKVQSAEWNLYAKCVDEQIIDRNSLIDKLQSQNKKLIEALKLLILLKDRKDTVGKDEFYIESQKEAWEKAKEALK
jgi:hypothetical protein